MSAAALARNLRRLMAALLLATLAACAVTPPPAPPPAPLPERFVALRYPYAPQEKVALVYWRGGAYLPDAMAQISRLMRDRKSGQSAPIDPRLVDFIVAVRDAAGLSPATAIDVIDGFRSDATNNRLIRAGKGSAKDSFHTKGQAADLRFDGVDERRVAELAKSLNRGGVAFYPRTGHVHLDVGPPRTWSVNAPAPAPAPAAVKPPAKPKPSGPKPPARGRSAGASRGSP